MRRCRDSHRTLLWRSVYVRDATAIMKGCTYLAAPDLFPCCTCFRSILTSARRSPYKGFECAPLTAPSSYPFLPFPSVFRAPLHVVTTYYVLVHVLDATWWCGSCYRTSFLHSSLGHLLTTIQINHLYFHHHEPNRLLIPLSILLIEPLILVWAFNSPSFPTIALTYLIFFTTLSTSIIAYRLSPFHPLAKYPGPSLYKISKLFSAWACWRGDLNIMLKKLHDHYGPIVRTGASIHPLSPSLS
jgi:hypothetical protein